MAAMLSAKPHLKIALRSALPWMAGVTDCVEASEEIDERTDHPAHDECGSMSEMLPQDQGP